MTVTPLPPPPAPTPPAASSGGRTGPVDEPPVVIGDDSTGRSRAASTWRRLRWPLTVLAAIALLVLFLAVVRPPTSAAPYAPDNPEENGGMAVAEVLKDQGVRITHVTTVAGAVAAAGPESTLLVTPSPKFFADDQISALNRTGADLVVLGADYAMVAAVSRNTIDSTYGEVDGPVPPQCDDPAAQAAGEVTLRPGLYDVNAGAGGDAVRPVLCWPDGLGAYAYARLDFPNRSVTVVDDPAVIRNGTVLDEGNAALALWMLGQQEDLVWLVPDPMDVSTGDDEPTPAERGQVNAMMPPGSAPVALVAVLTAVLLALWRVRRMGPLVVENLPVLVRSAEATRGRARLYRAARARGHAAAGLRASTADRIASRLGLARSSDATSVVDSVVAATNRPSQQVADLLYGPPPADDAALAELARRLDILESEVHRP
ncbi:protein of unknown function (DUF4350) [Promicromonospora umidemergens]|uniref:DUF4350 domain-containing protein n=1 Tax=Promicromonospora umidemergens TaxID=629679 RepID=A0ABP8YBU1_9MICO|nr:DUF4350 domain-containing protein [Promicromonospora umidemergens]MCP2284690.1 protein of unknown function (DUF4350) [Promicromonospora umidemergens]